MSFSSLKLANLLQFHTTKIQIMKINQFSRFRINLIKYDHSTKQDSALIDKNINITNKFKDNAIDINFQTDILNHL